LTSASITPWAEVCAAAFMWRGKPTPAPSWRRASKRAPWLQALSGRTSAPSTLELCAALSEWFAAAVPVKTSPLPANEPGLTEGEAASFFTSSASLRSASPASSSGKTSAAQLQLFPESSAPSSPSATEALPPAFVLLTWERPTDDSASSFWPTATLCGNNNRKGLSPTSGDGLATAARTWGAPRASDGERGGPGQTLKGKPALSAQAASWPTPDASVSTGYNQGGANGRTGPKRPALAALAKMWPTPAARDYKGANGPEHLAKTRGHHDQLPNAVVLSGLQAPLTSTDGAPTSQQEGRLRLSPDFVEALMGWPAGHSIPFGLTDCDCSATALSPNRPPRPSPSSLPVSESSND